MMKLNPSATLTEEFAERIRSENRSNRMMKLAPVLVLVAMLIVFLVTCGPSFLGPQNLVNILNQMMEAESRMNEPGTTGGNWRWRLLPGEVDEKLVEKLARCTRLYGRG